MLKKTLHIFQGRLVRPCLFLLSVMLLTTGSGYAESFPDIADPAAPPPKAGIPDSNMSRPTPRIKDIAASLTLEKEADAKEEKDIQLILAAMRYVGENLAYDPWHNRDQFTRSADTLFQERTLGGCSEYALAELALIKALGYPARLALSMNINWYERNKTNDLAVPNGHSFIEVWLGQEWALVDPTYFQIYSPYTPGHAFLPGKEVFMARGGDFVVLGIHSVGDANAMLRKKAAAYQGGHEEPPFPIRAAAQFDFPKAFAVQGKLFLDKGNARLARRFFNKSLLLDPQHARALAWRALLHARDGARAEAAADLKKALELAPGDEEVLAVQKELGLKGE